MCVEMPSLQRFYHPALVATCCNVRLHLSGMGGGRIAGGGGVRRGGGLRHILCPYMGMKFTRSGESSHWRWWMGRRAEGAAKVYIRRKRGSRWCEIHSKQIPTEEQRRKGIPLIAFYTFWHRPLRIICWKPSNRRFKENNHLHNLFYIFPSYLLFFSPGRDGLLSTSLCWTIWIWMRKILFTLSLRIATVLPWEWKTACGKTTRRCTSMQSGGYLPSLATVSSHLCTVDNMFAWWF